MKENFKLGTLNADSFVHEGSHCPSVALHVRITIMCLRETMYRAVK
jgi:hypothetical protein